MLSNCELQIQLENAVKESRSRYIVTAIIDGHEFDAGEIIIGPLSDLSKTECDILTNMRKRLQKLSLPENAVDNASIIIEPAPLLY